MGKTEQCAFCPAKADDGEHIWSDWFGKLLGPKAYSMFRKELDGSVKRWDSGKLNSKTKVVCGDCNHGWMSKLENQTKSVIQHMAVSCSPTTLGAVDIETIAQFAFLKGVVADHSHDNRKPFFTLSERHHFRESLELPAGFQVWLASMLTQHGLFKGHYFIAPQDVSGRCEINVFTYGLGHFLVQTTTGRWMRKAYRRHSLPPAARQGSAWLTLSIPVWPNPKSRVYWPPTDYLEHEFVDDYATRWKLLNLNPHNDPHPTGGSLISMPRMISSKAITRRRRRI